jgi:hypothetical protein
MESVRLSFDPKFLALIQESRLSVARDGGVPLEEVEAMLNRESKPRRKKTA